MSGERVVVEGVDGHGRVQWRERVTLHADRTAFTIGRSMHADVTLDDPHAAALHASVEIKPDGRIFVNDLGSMNGLVVCGKRWLGARGLELPDHTLQIGRTRLRVRTAHEPLEPERPYYLRASLLVHSPAWIAAIAALLGGLQLVYVSWLSAPRDLAASIVTSSWAAVSIAAIWVAVWGLLSRVMQGEWRWLRHSAIFLGVSVTFVALMGLLDMAEFVFALPPANNRYMWIGAVALAFALYLHLTHASSLRAVRAALVAFGIPVLLAAGNHWLQERYQVRNVNYIGARMRIYPPSLRLQPSETPANYFKRASGLREIASRRLIDALANDPQKDDEN